MLFLCSLNYIDMCIYLQGYNNAFVYWWLNQPNEQTQQKFTVSLVIFIRHQDTNIRVTLRLPMKYFQLYCLFKKNLQKQPDISKRWHCFPKKAWEKKYLIGMDMFFFLYVYIYQQFLSLFNIIYSVTQF